MNGFQFERFDGFETLNKLVDKWVVHDNSSDRKTCCPLRTFYASIPQRTAGADRSTFSAWSDQVLDDRRLTLGMLPDGGVLDLRIERLENGADFFGILARS